MRANNNHRNTKHRELGFRAYVKLKSKKYNIPNPIRVFHQESEEPATEPEEPRDLEFEA